MCFSLRWTNTYETELSEPFVPPFVCLSESYCRHKLLLWKCQPLAGLVSILMLMLISLVNIGTMNPMSLSGGKSLLLFGFDQRKRWISPLNFIILFSTDNKMITNWSGNWDVGSIVKFSKQLTSPATTNVLSKFSR